MLARAEQFAEAERHFRAAIATDATAPARTALAFVLHRQGRSDVALAQLQLAVANDPAYLPAKDSLAALYVEHGKLADAERIYRERIAVQPTAAAHQGLAEALMRAGREEEAQKELDAARALAPASPATGASGS